MVVVKVVGIVVVAAIFNNVVVAVVVSYVIVSVIVNTVNVIFVFDTGPWREIAGPLTGPYGRALLLMPPFPPLLLSMIFNLVLSICCIVTLLKCSNFCLWDLQSDTGIF